MKSTMQCVLDNMIDRGEEIGPGNERRTKLIQIGLRGQAQPIGPGTVRRVTDRIGDTATTYYKMFVEAMLGNPQQPTRGRRVTLPILFAAEDVVMILDEPMNADGESMIVPAGSMPAGLRPPGGS